MQGTGGGPPDHAEDDFGAGSANLLTGILGLPPNSLGAPGSGQLLQHPLQFPTPGFDQQAAQQVPWQQMAPPGNTTQAESSWLKGGGGKHQGGRLDPHAMAAKLAASREKNRLAQQRFRERQRAKQKEAGQQCQVLQQEMEELEMENDRLLRQNRIYEKVLAVRDAMLQTFTTLQPPGQQQAAQAAAVKEAAVQGLPPASAAAAQGLARALDELPTEVEMEDAAPPAEEAAVAAAERSLPAPPPAHASLPPSQQQQQQREGGPEGGTASSGSCSSARDLTGGVQAQTQAQAQAQELPVAPQPQPRLLLGEAHRTGAASGLDGSALQDVEYIPPPSNQLVRARVAAMTEPEQLLDYFREWQAELSVSYLAAEAAGFDETSVREVEGVTDRMTEMWFHVGQLRPDYLCYLAHAALPEQSSQMQLWADIAAKVLPQMDENKRAIVRRSWYNYSKRLAKAAVGVSKWVKRLQQYSVSTLPPDALAGAANRALELSEITRHVAAAVQEEYLASMEFVAAQTPASSTLLKAYVNHASAPYLPDLVAIVYHILRLDAEEKAAAAAAAAATQAAVAQAQVEAGAGDGDGSVGLAQAPAAEIDAGATDTGAGGGAGVGAEGVVMGTATAAATEAGGLMSSRPHSPPASDGTGASSAAAAAAAAGAMQEQQQ